MTWRAGYGRRTGIDFDPHWWRHTADPDAARRRLTEVVSRLLGHVHVITTAAACGHLTVEDARRVLEQEGWFTGREVRW